MGHHSNTLIMSLLASCCLSLLISFHFENTIVEGRHRLDYKNPLLSQERVFLTAKFGRYDEAYWYQVEQAEDYAANLNIYDSVYSYSTFPSWILSDSTWERHLTFYNTNSTTHESYRGGGFWFWKPQLILHHLKLLDNHDWLIYGDADQRSFHWWVPTVSAYMLNHNATFAVFETPNKIHQYTKGDIYHKFCDIKPWEDESFQDQGGIMVIQKRKGTVELMQRWAEAMADYHRISDEPSVHLNHPDFTENRHDQSILSILLLCVFGKKPRVVPDVFYGTDKDTRLVWFRV